MNQNLSTLSAEEHSLRGGRGGGRGRHGGEGVPLPGILSLPAVTSLPVSAGPCEVNARFTLESVMLWNVVMSSSLGSMNYPTSDQNGQQHFACTSPFKFVKLGVHSLDVWRPGGPTLSLANHNADFYLLRLSIPCTF